MKIRILRCAAAALLISVFVHPQIAQAFPVARLRRVKPVVEVRGDAQTWTAAKERNSLSYGQWVRTGPRGGADVMFNNGTQLALRANTQIEIVAPPTSTQPLVVRVVGALSEVFVRARGRTEIRTAAGTAAVRGTEYSVRLPAENAAVLTVLEGIVQFYNPQGSVLVLANQQSSMEVGHAPTAPIAVDASGLLSWTAEIAGLPVVWETTGFVTGAAPSEALKLRAAGDPAAASAALGANAADTESLAVRMLLALDKNDFAAATAAYDAAPAAVQNGAPALAVRGMLALQRGLPADAISFANRAIAIAPGLAAAHDVLALSLTQTGQTRPAVASARRAVELAPASAASRSVLAWSLFFDGNALDASREASRAIEAEPFSPFALLVYGRAQLAAGERDEAVRALGQAQGLAPESGLIEREAGEAWLALQDAPRAQKAFAIAAREENSGSVRAAALGGLGEALAAQGKHDEAEAAFKSALAVDEGVDQRGVRGRYGAFLIERGRLKEADALLQVGGAAGLAKSQIADVPLLIRLAEVSLLRQDLPSALAYAQRAVKLAPRSAPARYELGRVYLEQDRTTFAEEQFRQAVALDDDFAAARFALGITREQIENGKDPSRQVGSLAAASSTGPGAALSFQNVLSAGASERIQAAVQDPTVFRTASRAYGDTQVDGAFGTNGARSYAVSHLQEGDNNRSALGVTASRDETDGFRPNTDSISESLGALVGMKSRRNPSGLFALGQIDTSRGGANDTLQSTALDLTSRFRKRVPLAILGGNLQRSQNSRTRFLFGYDEPTYNSIDAFGFNNSRFRSIHSEVRYDRRSSSTLRWSSGAAIGRRSVNNDNFILGPAVLPPLPPAPGIIGSGDTTIDFATGYIRGEKQLSPKLSFLGELKVQRMRQRVEFSTAFTDPLLPPLVPQTHVFDQTTAVLPTASATYRAGDRDTLRFRVRGFRGNVQDFELLSPVDVWAFSENDGLFVNLFGHGRSLEVQGDHTFGNGAFMRYGVFEQRGTQLVATGGQPVADGVIRGVRLRYEGILNRSTTYYLRGELNDTSGTVITTVGTFDGNISQVPRGVVEGGLYYLAKSGWFVQPSIAYVGAREQDITAPQNLGGMALENIRFGKRFGLRAVTFVEVVNVGDKNYSLNALQKPGRQIRVGASARF